MKLKPFNSGTCSWTWAAIAKLWTGGLNKQKLIFIISEVWVSDGCFLSGLQEAAYSLCPYIAFPWEDACSVTEKDEHALQLFFSQGH